MSTLTRRDYRGPFVDIIDWIESPWTVLRPVASQPMRVEDYVKDGYYVVRAELPGIDPEKDIELTVSKGVLTIAATRHEEAEGKHRSEFRYGTFTRSVTLPASSSPRPPDCRDGTLHDVLTSSLVPSRRTREGGTAARIRPQVRRPGRRCRGPLVPSGRRRTPLNRELPDGHAGRTTHVPIEEAS